MTKTFVIVGNEIDPKNIEDVAKSNGIEILRFQEKELYQKQLQLLKDEMIKAASSGEEIQLIIYAHGVDNTLMIDGKPIMFGGKPLSFDMDLPSSITLGGQEVSRNDLLKFLSEDDILKNALVTVEQFSCRSGKDLLPTQKPGKKPKEKQAELDFLPENWRLVINAGKYSITSPVTEHFIKHLISHQNQPFFVRKLLQAGSSPTFKMFYRNKKGDLVGFKHEAPKIEEVLESIQKGESVIERYKNIIIDSIRSFQKNCEDSQFDQDEKDQINQLCRGEIDKIAEDENYAKQIIADYVSDEFFDYVNRNKVDRIKILLEKHKASLDELGFKIDEGRSGIRPLYYAAYKGYADLVKILIAAGSSIYKENPNNNASPFDIAVIKGHEDVVLAFAESGFDVDRVNNVGITPLHLAVKSGNKNIVEVLISANANVNCMDEDGHTPLHLAANKGHEIIAEMLIKSSAMIDSKASDNNDITPLHVAAYEGNVGVMNLLIAAGANVNQKSRDGKTALDFAREQYEKEHQEKHSNVIEVLTHEIELRTQFPNTDVRSRVSAPEKLKTMLSKLSSCYPFKKSNQQSK